MTPRILSLLVAGAFAAAFAFASCSPVQDSSIGIDAPPYSENSFRPVADYIEQRCGTLDCHGQMSRNFRVWGCDGLRLAPDASSGVCPGGTTNEEYEATYRSLVGLEPQVMTQVFAGCSAAIADGGTAYPPGSSCDPDQLTFMRKARGLEAHKGGQLICIEAPCPAGIPPQIPLDGDAGGILVDPQDVCLVSWLEGATNVVFCGKAEGIPDFPSSDIEAGTP